jgi:hypothetical protein
MPPCEGRCGCWLCAEKDWYGREVGVEEDDDDMASGGGCDVQRGNVGAIQQVLNEAQ